MMAASPASTQFEAVCKLAQLSVVRYFLSNSFAFFKNAIPITMSNADAMMHNINNNVSIFRTSETFFIP